MKPSGTKKTVISHLDENPAVVSSFFFFFFRFCSVPIQDFATRFCGSPDLYGKGRKPYNSINFIVAHDGFSLYDLCSYNDKHNQENGENNNDGERHNDSWNCGVEGETGDEGILKLRTRQCKNFMVSSRAEKERRDRRSL